MEYQLGFQLSWNLINKYCNINQNKFKEIILLLQLKERTLGLVCVRKITYIFLKILPCYFPISLQFCFLWLSLKKRPVTVSSTVTVVLIIVDYCIIKMYIGFVIVMLELNVLKVYMTWKVIAAYLKSLWYWHLILTFLYCAN